MPNISEFIFQHASAWYVISQDDLRRIRRLYRYKPSNAIIVTAARTLGYQFKPDGKTIHLIAPKERNDDAGWPPNTITDKQSRLQALYPSASSL